jgi:putative glutamine amidotransferase
MSTFTIGLDPGPPRIGISCGAQTQSTAFGEQGTFSLIMRYVRAVATVGGLPLPLVPSGADPAALLSAVDGLVLTGGGDLDPSAYGEQPAEQVYGVDRERDDFEFALLSAAQVKGVPVLAICRGMQLVNVSRGGTLIQHVEDADLHWQVNPAHEGAHTVSVLPDSLLAAWLGAEELLVNSYHHQAIGDLGEGLQVVAEARGLAEAFQTADGLVTGVQWHPEQMFEHHPRHHALFAAFISQVADRRHTVHHPTTSGSNPHA